MTAATFSATRVSKDGKPAVQFVVRNSLSNPALHAECLRLGMTITVDIANSREIICITNDQITAVQSAMRPFFAK